MAVSKIPKEKDTRILLEGAATKFRVATSNNYVTIRAYSSDTDYLELAFNSTQIAFRNIANGTSTDIWYK